MSASRRAPGIERLASLLGLLAVLAGSAGATVADINEAGKAAYARGDFAAAERLFGEASARAPQEPILHYHRGVALTRLGRLREAAGAYQAALRLDPPPALAAEIRRGLAEIAAASQPAPARRGPPDRDEIPLLRASGLWFVQVVVNDMRSARFLVDTGATFTTLSPEIAGDLGLERDGDARSVEIQTAAGRIKAHRVTLGSVRVGDVEAQNVRAVVHSLPGIDGILGNTFLGRYSVTIEPERGLLILRSK
jgi:clan AA aspartic protease (TIGR02281 family)